MAHPESFGTEHLLRARVEQRDEHVEIAVAGELDLGAAEPFEARIRYLAAVAPGGVVLDLADLDFIDSVGIRSLIVVRRDLDEEGRTLVIRNARGPVARVLAMTGLVDS